MNGQGEPRPGTAGAPLHRRMEQGDLGALPRGRPVGGAERAVRGGRGSVTEPALTVSDTCASRSGWPASSSTLSSIARCHSEVTKGLSERSATA